MIIFKTELEKMPSCCIYCSAEYKCKYAFPINLDMQEALKLPPIRPTDCPLLEIPDPKPESTLTQHEHDLIQIIKKVYPDMDCIVITDNDCFINFTSEYVRLELIKTPYIYIGVKSPVMELFDKTKLPTLMSEFENRYHFKIYNINDLLSRPIRKEPK